MTRAASWVERVMRRMLSVSRLIFLALPLAWITAPVSCARTRDVAMGATWDWPTRAAAWVMAGIAARSPSTVVVSGSIVACSCDRASAMAISSTSWRCSWRLVAAITASWRNISAWIRATSRLTRAITRSSNMAVNSWPRGPSKSPSRASVGAPPTAMAAGVRFTAATIGASACGSPIATTWATRGARTGGTMAFSATGSAAPATGATTTAASLASGTWAIATAGTTAASAAALATTLARRPAPRRFARTAATGATTAGPGTAGTAALRR